MLKTKRVFRTDFVLELTWVSSIVEAVQTIHGPYQTAHQHATKVPFYRILICVHGFSTPSFSLTGLAVRLTDITDSYANLFQCPGNGDWKNMTCSTSGDAESACGSGAVGSYTYVSGGYVTMAQAGGFISNSTCNSTNKNAGSNNVTDSTSSAQTPACSGSSHSSTVALGAGLGAGLGIPLLICTAVLVYCAASRRRKLPYSQQKPEDMNQSTAGRPAPPAELDEGTQRVEMGDKLVTRSELHGYDTPQF